MVYGIAEYPTQSAAEAETPPASVPLRIQVQGRRIARLTFQKSAGTAASITSAFDEGGGAGSGVTNHLNLSNLTPGDAGHTDLALLGGRSGGQTFIGGTGSGENLKLSSTTHSTKGDVESTDPISITDATGGDLLKVGVTTDAASPRVTLRSQNSGFALPSNTDASSDGDKWVFWNHSSYKGAIGFDTRTMWFQSTEGTSTTNNRFQYFAGSAGAPVELLTFGDDAGWIWNELGLDINFRCEGVTDANLFFVDASTDRIGIGTATPSVKFDVNGDMKVSSGTFSLSTGTTVNEISTEVTFVGNSDDVAKTEKSIKTYVDDHASNGIWQRTGTVISPKNAGDTYNLGTGIASYNAHPSFTSDTEIIDKKYVDDHGGTAVGVYKDLTSQIVSGGETSFTLDSTPVDPNSAQLFLEGQKRYYGASNDFTISGTTLTWNNSPVLAIGQVFEVQYDFQMGGGPLAQAQIYYFADAGDDSNNGKSEKFPFLTYGAAKTAVDAQTPGSGNRFEVRRIGSGTITEDVVISTYTTLYAPSLHINGTVTLNEQSKLYFDEVTAPNSASCLKQTTSVKSYASGNLINGGTSSIGIDSNQGELRTNIKKIDMTGAGSKAWNLNTSAALFITYDTLRENVASTKTGGAIVFENGLDSGSNADTRIYNEVGRVILKGSNVVFDDTTAKFSDGTTEIFTNVGQFPKWTNTPLLSARTSGEIPNVTGLSAYTVLFDNDIVNIGAHYNPATGGFSYPVTGYYLICSSIGFDHLAAAHNRFFAYIDAGGGQLRYMGMGNAATMRRNPGVNDDLFVSGSHIVKGLNGGGAQVDISVGGGVSNTVAITENSSFDVYLLGAA
jgi:hypothetical protein